MDAVGRVGAKLQPVQHVAGEVFRSSLVPGHHEQGIGQPPGTRLEGAPLDTVQVLVVVQGLTVEDVREISPATILLGRHGAKSRLVGLVGAGKIAQGVPRVGRESEAPPSFCRAGSGSRSRFLWTPRLHEVANPLADDPPLPGRRPGGAFQEPDQLVPRHLHMRALRAGIPGRIAVVPEAEPADDLVAASRGPVPKRKVPAAGALERPLGPSRRFEGDSAVHELRVGNLWARVQDRERRHESAFERPAGAGSAGFAERRCGDDRRQRYVENYAGSEHNHRCLPLEPSTRKDGMGKDGGPRCECAPSVSEGGAVQGVSMVGAALPDGGSSSRHSFFVLFRGADSGQVSAASFVTGVPTRFRRAAAAPPAGRAAKPRRPESPRTVRRRPRRS